MSGADDNIDDVGVGGGGVGRVVIIKLGIKLNLISQLKISYPAWDQGVQNCTKLQVNQLYTNFICGFL